MLPVVVPALRGFYAGLSAPEVDKKHGSYYAVEAALLAGTLIIVGSSVRGTPSAAISKELRAMGGKYQSMAGGWHIPIANIPMRIRLASMRANEIRTSWLAKLQGEIPKLLTPVISMTPMLAAMHALNVDVVHAVEEATGVRLFPSVPSEPSPAVVNYLEVAFENFASIERAKLIDLTRMAANKGWTVEKLAKLLAGRQVISDDKALRMAQQAMAIGATEIKGRTFTESGYPKYRWITKRDVSVRASHAELDGRVFDWSDPPVVNAQGDRRHPGGDYHCRCSAQPVGQMEVSA